MCIRDRLFRIVHTIIHRVIILKAAVIFPGRLTAGDTRRAQMLNILHSVKGNCIENMGRFATAVTDNAVCGLLKSAGFQRVRVIPVSYTHLDVYKRQAPYRAVLGK